MKMVGTAGQQHADDYYDYSGTITTGGTAQLCLPQRKSCSFLMIVNNSSGPLTIEFGLQRATAVLTGTAVSSITLVNNYFGLIYPPTVTILGGGNANDPTMGTGATMPDWPSPFNPAQAVATISGGSVSAITVSNGGSGYTAPPYVYLTPDRRDPTGVGQCSLTFGSTLTSYGSNYYVNGTMCPTSAISIWGATTGQAYSVKWAS